MTASPLELGGMLLACGGAAAALLARDPRLRYGAAAVALVAAPALVAGDVWHTERFVDLRHDPAKLVAVIVVSVAAVGGAAAVFYRLPWAFPVSAFAALPLRVPVQLGGETSHLLLPLYLVIAAGFACFAYRALARAGSGATDSRRRSRRMPRAARRPLRHLALPRPGRDPGRLRDPDRVLGPRLERDRERRLLPGPVRGHVRPAHRGPLDSPPLGRGARRRGRPGPGARRAWRSGSTRRATCCSAGGTCFSRTSCTSTSGSTRVFYDPNVFGRYLALALVALGAYLAWARGRARRGRRRGRRRLSCWRRWRSATRSPASAALVAGLLVVAALRWSVRWALAGGAAILVCGAIFLLVSGTGESDLGSAKDFDTTTSGRVDLVRGGLELAEDRPVWGWGSGSFGAAFSRHIERARTTVSHSEPITVAAEQGAIGLVVYVALVGLGPGRSAERRRRLGGDGRGRGLLRGDARPQPQLCGLCDRPRHLGAARAWVSRCGARGPSRRPPPPPSATAAPSLPATGDPPRV